MLGFELGSFIQKFIHLESFLKYSGKFSKIVFPEKFTTLALYE